MTKIIDLKNGYGMIENYGSRYASLIFPLTLSRVRRLHAKEVISDTEAQIVLLKMGYDLPQTKWIVAVGKINTEQWKAAVNGLRTI